MYDELVKRLWECASGECFNCSQYTPTTNASVCQKELMKQAADAIEELQKRIPKSPHGRLIDADALADVFRGFIAMYDSCPFSQLPQTDKARRDELQSALAEVINAPTIIPAEEGE